MSTMEGNPTVLQVLLHKAYQGIARRKGSKPEAMSRVRAWFVATVRFLYSLGGFGCLTLAGFSLNITIGLVVAGVSFFGLSWLTTSGTPTIEREQRPEPRLR